MLFAIERDLDEAVLNHREDEASVPEVKRALRDHRLAGEERFADMARQLDGPRMMVIIAVCKRDEEAGIGDRLHFFEKPFRRDRSFVPEMAPARRMKGRLERSDRALSSCSRTICPCDTPIRSAVSFSPLAS